MDIVGSDAPQSSRGAGMALRIEIFVADLDAFVFYTRVLGFELNSDRRTAVTPYAAVVRDTVRTGAVHQWTSVDRGQRAVPTGTEVVLEVDDLDAEYRRVTAVGWPLAEEVRQRPWGLTDFRVYDPDGYYIRITDR